MITGVCKENTYLRSFCKHLNLLILEIILVYCFQFRLYCI